VELSESTDVQQSAAERSQSGLSAAAGGAIFVVKGRIE